MKSALCLLALVALCLAQDHSTHPPPPDFKCYCSMGIHTVFDDVIFFKWHPFYDAQCDEAAERLCIEECVEHRDVLQAAGGWEVHIPEHHHPGNLTVGDIACQNLGRDESHGIHGRLYHSICDHPTRNTGHGLLEPLCCDAGMYTPCAH